MKRLLIELPTLGFIVATRAALGVGLGLLLSERIPQSRRRSAAMALIAVGAVTTVPAVMAIANGIRAAQAGADAW